MGSDAALPLMRLVDMEKMMEAIDKTRACRFIASTTTITKLRRNAAGLRLVGLSGKKR